MSLTDTSALAAAAIKVLDTEALLTSLIARRADPALIASTRADLASWQLAYEVEVLARTPGFVTS